MHPVFELADRVWNGEVPYAHGLVTEATGFAPITDNVGFVASFANVSAFRTDAGLVLVDTGSFLFANMVRDQLKGWCDDSLSHAVFTHGHVDHCFGVDRWDREAQERGDPCPQVVAHHNILARFERYRLTEGYNRLINSRQFGVPLPFWPTNFREPDVTYHQQHTLHIGGLTFELHHAKGETDDATWVWFPSERIVCTGDLFIWVSPNCGNPQKAQRYPRQWAQALRAIAALEPEVLLPGHGPPLTGTDRIQEALGNGALYLESLVEQTLELMNQGHRLDEILHRVQPPEDLADKPYLQPLYDEPEFIVRNLWRLYGGWYDGNPAHLKPAPDEDLARELARLCGGATEMAVRAMRLADRGDFRVACHLAEFAAQARPDDEAIDSMRRKIYRMRSDDESSTMAQGIYRDAASD